MQNYVEALLEELAAAAADQLSPIFAAVNKVPAPIYVTDENGLVLHFNPWCRAFAGRVPQAGKDRWCVTWRLYDMEGHFLPHEACPMAIAVLNKTKVRGVCAVAARPDGTQVTFVPFPTPVFSRGGQFLGAVNILVDVTEPRQHEDLLEQASRCERLAALVGDQQASEALQLMAIQYTIKAEALASRAPGEAETKVPALAQS